MNKKAFVNNSSKLERFGSLQNKLSSLIETSWFLSKIAKNLSLSISSKTYLYILKSFLKSKKVPGVPSIFHEKKIITDFREKAELFNSIFANQCSLIKTTRVITPNFESQWHWENN